MPDIPDRALERCATEFEALKEEAIAESPEGWQWVLASMIWDEKLSGRRVVYRKSARRYWEDARRVLLVELGVES